MGVFSVALILIHVFLIVTFIISAYEKVSAWDTSKKHYVDAFKNVLPSYIIILSLLVITLTEVTLTCLLGYGIYDLAMGLGYYYVNYALVGSGALFIFLLAGLRLMKDYEGASRIAVYFLITMLGFLM